MWLGARGWASACTLETTVAEAFAPPTSRQPHVLTTAHSLPLAFLLLACHGGGSADGSTQRATAPASAVQRRAANGVPAIEDNHFVEEAFYRGECFETAQGGGGCWSLTLLPDGTAEHMYVDVLVRERYQIDGRAVVLRTRKGVERLESTDGFVTLGSYKLVPPTTTAPASSAP